ncbi:MAG: hypothetical protein PHD02_01035 [Bacilli bacterium]|nr:hypothetical protein [Bacilli bacterium]
MVEVEKIKEILKPVVSDLGFILDDVVYEKEGKMNFLRVYFDKSEPICLDDCVTVSKAISPVLDELDPIEENYILDVGSKERGR